MSLSSIWWIQEQPSLSCALRDFTHAALVSGPRPALKTATGELLKHDSQRTVDFWCQGEEFRVGLTAVDVKRLILSVSLVGRVCADLTVLLLNSHVVVVFFVMQCQVAVPM